MATYQEPQSAHVRECELCQRQIAAPQPFHEDLCHFGIRPDDPYGEMPPVQCPHLAEPFSGKSKLCGRHLDDALGAYEAWVARSAPLN